MLNSLTPGRNEWNFRWVIFKLIFLVIDGWASREITLRWMPLDLTDHKSTLLQVLAWCLMAPMITWANVDPYGTTRPGNNAQPTYWWLSTRLWYLHCWYIRVNLLWYDIWTAAHYAYQLLYIVEKPMSCDLFEDTLVSLEVVDQSSEAEAAALYRLLVLE